MTGGTFRLAHAGSRAHRPFARPGTGHRAVRTPPGRSGGITSSENQERVADGPATPRLLLVNEASMGVGHLGHGRVTDVLLEVMPARGWEVEVLTLPELGALGRMMTRGWPVLRQWDADLSQVRWH